MDYIILVQYIVVLYILTTGTIFASEQRFPAYLHGERRLDSYYANRYPLVQFDRYSGKISFQDDLNLHDYFTPYLFDQESEYTGFIKSELYASSICTNKQLEKHSSYIQYAYRLLTLSYLLEANWHMDLVSSKILKKNSCTFDFEKWLDSCRPVSPDMKKFITQLRRYKPKYRERLPDNYQLAEWFTDFKNKNYNFYSHFRISEECGPHCEVGNLPTTFQKACESDQRLMTLICSEKDEVYGLSSGLEAYQLLAQSNIINSFNSEGEALGCLRRFSTSFAHREVRYKSLSKLFLPLREHLHRLYQERFIQGRVFFYGSGKEFEEKGLTNLHVMEQPIKIAQLTVEEKIEIKPETAPIDTKTNKLGTVQKSSIVEEVKIQPIQKSIPQKSAFLLAADYRREQKLDFMSVDMNKLRYDYIFSLNTLNVLSSKLKTFMTRDALKEMKMYDKLGTPYGPVPLLFLKYMIDMQEHTGIFNLLSVLGHEFYVSNEIDVSYQTQSEKIKIENGPHTENQWQIVILKP